MTELLLAVTMLAIYWIICWLVVPLYERFHHVKVKWWAVPMAKWAMVFNTTLPACAVRKEDAR